VKSHAIGNRYCVLHLVIDYSSLLGEAVCCFVVHSCHRVMQADVLRAAILSLEVAKCVISRLVYDTMYSIHTYFLSPHPPVVCCLLFFHTSFTTDQLVYSQLRYASVFIHACISFYPYLPAATRDFTFRLRCLCSMFSPSERTATCQIGCVNLLPT
jgi:cytochrome bd-type quinol oxidase subunit 2